MDNSSIHNSLNTNPSPSINDTFRDGNNTLHIGTPIGGNYTDSNGIIVFSDNK